MWEGGAGEVEVVAVVVLLCRSGVVHMWHEGPLDLLLLYWLWLLLRLLLGERA